MLNLKSIYKTNNYRFFFLKKFVSCSISYKIVKHNINIESTFELFKSLQGGGIKGIV